MTVMTGNNKTPIQIQTRLATRREGIAKKARVRKSKKPLGPDLTSVRRFLHGSTYNQARVERRGAKRKLPGRQLQKVDTTRKKMCAQGALGPNQSSGRLALQAWLTPPLPRAT